MPLTTAISRLRLDGRGVTSLEFAIIAVAIITAIAAALPKVSASMSASFTAISANL